MALGLKSHEQIPESSSQNREKVSRKRGGIKRAILDGLEGKKDRLQSYLALGIFAIGLLNSLINLEPINLTNIPNAPTAVAAEYNYSADQTNFGEFPFGNESVGAETKVIGTEENTVLYFDDNQEPIAYSFINSETGRESEPILFTAEQQDYLKAAKQKAQETGLPQLAQFVVEDSENPLSALDIISKNTIGAAIIYDEPKDVLSPEQLANHGVTIINPNNESAQLLLREEIFNSGLLKPLEDLRGLGINRQIIIVPINSPFIDYDALTTEQQSELAKVTGDSFITLKSTLITKSHENRADLIKTQVEYIAFLEKQIQNHLEIIAQQNPGPELESYTQNLAFMQENILLVRNLSPAEFGFSLYRDGIWLIGGSPSELSTGLHLEINEINSNFIFVSMGDASANMSDRILFWVNPDGSFAITNKNISSPTAILLKSVPSPNDSYQTVDDFEYDPNANSNKGDYIFKTYSPIKTARHEIAHALLSSIIPNIKERMKLTNANYSYTWLEDLIALLNLENMPQGENIIPTPTRNEYYVDLVTKASILAAEQQPKDNQDKSGYPFVIKLPKNKIAPDGSWIISEMLPKKPSNQGLT